MKSGFKIIVLIVAITVFGCEKSTIVYGPDFPFKKTHESVMDMGTWEINKVTYEFSLQSRDIFFINNDTGFLVGNGGRIFRTTDSGQNWRRMDSGTLLNLVSVYFINNKVGYASSEGLNCPWHDCSNGSLLLKTTDCGETWTQLLFHEYYRILSLRFFDESHAVALIYTKGQADTLKPNVATTSNGGSSWKMGGFDLKPGVEKLFFSEDLVFIQGRHQQIYKSSDHGVTWDTINAPVIQNNSVRYFYFINENVGFSDVMTGIYKTSDGGNTWFEVQFPFPCPDPLYFYDENEGFRVKGTYIFSNGSSYPTSEGSNYYLTLDGGSSWTQGMFGEMVDMGHTHFPSPGSGFGFWKSDFYKYTRKGD